MEYRGARLFYQKKFRNLFWVKAKFQINSDNYIIFSLFIGLKHCDKNEFFSIATDDYHVRIGDIARRTNEQRGNQRRQVTEPKNQREPTPELPAEKRTLTRFPSLNLTDRSHARAMQLWYVHSIYIPTARICVRIYMDRRVSAKALVYGKSNEQCLAEERCEIQLKNLA